MAGWVDDFFASMDRAINGPKDLSTSGCMGDANAKTAAMEAKIVDLSKNWNPTGFYTPTQMQGIIQMIQGALREGSKTIDRELAEPTAQGDRGALAIEKAAIARKMNESLTYTRAFADAQQRGIAVIDSPGFKRFVVTSMQVARDAVTAAATVACNRPWFVSALATFQIYFDTIWTLAKAIVNVAVKIGETVLEIPDTVATLWTYAKVAAVGVGLWWLYERGPSFYKSLTR